MRGFEKISSFKNKDFNLPKRSTSGSAGYDFFSPKKYLIKSNQIVFLETGIKSYMNEDEVLKIFNRSSMAIKNNIFLVNYVAIIDSDYYNNENNEGHIILALKNNSNKDYEINKNDKIAQGIFEKFLKTENDLQDKIRKSGIGSTGY